MSEESDTKKDALEFLWNVHKYTNDYIRFADTKASLVLVAATGLVATLFTVKANQFCSLSQLHPSEASAKATLLGGVTGMAFFWLFLCQLSCVFAIFPRLWRTRFKSTKEWVRQSIFSDQTPGPMGNPERGYIYFGEVSSYPNATDYWNAVEVLSKCERGRSVAKHIHVLAAIANRKFGWISTAVCCGFIGSVFALLFFFI